ncbi:Protein of unknown function [Cotesia congregata]|uniref:RNase H type-1 domain-containing protein n=1 Tax=Cotesia congregata TaxID=51543 RepID=A0A8J2MAW8_COTCN|nr:Protein of unknown function [Cotesia congregata]
MIFTRKKKIQPESAKLFLNNKELLWACKLKILGILFNKFSTWKLHITELKRQCHQRLNLLKSIASNKWGADSQILINTYRAIIRSKLDYGCTLYQFASNHHLKKLDSIQITSLRIALGAYRTSPRVSLLAESGETPLDIRREQLSLNFASSAPSIIPELHQNQPQRHLNLTSDNSSEIHDLLIKLTNNVEFRNLTLYHPQFSQVPSWLAPTECYDLSIGERTWEKENTPAILYRNLFAEIINQLDQFTQIYTDGSILNNLRGCAIIINDRIFKYKLPPSYSIFSCEAFAILKSLKLIGQLNIHKAAIFSDSKSVIKALLNPNSSDNIIQEFQAIIYNTKFILESSESSGSPLTKVLTATNLQTTRQKMQQPQDLTLPFLSKPLLLTSKRWPRTTSRPNGTDFGVWAHLIYMKSATTLQRQDLSSKKDLTNAK